MADLNLDRYIAEHEEEPHKVTLGGKVYLLPAKLPLIFADLLKRGEMIAALECLFGDDAFEVGKRLGISGEDADTGGVLAPLMELYGLGVPEVSASSDSSPNTGVPSRQISNGSTGGTSERTVSARTS